MRRARASLLVLGLVVAVAMAALSAEPSRAATGDGVGLRLREATSWVAPVGSAHATVAVTGAPAGATLHATLYGAVPTRSAFVLAARGRALQRQIKSLPVQDLAAGSSTHRVGIEVDDGGPDATAGGDQVTITSPGVHPLEIQVHDASGAELASLVTFLVRLPQATPAGSPTVRKPLHVATELRLVVPPSHDAAGTADVSAATRRRVEQLVGGLDTPRASADDAIQVGITPELLDALATSRKADDRRLLARLKIAVADRDLTRLPYVGIDLPRWLVTPSLTGGASRQLTVGEQATAHHLHEADLGTADVGMWSADRTSTTEDELAWLAEQGTNRFLIPGSSLVPLDDARFPRTLAAPFALDLPDGRRVRAMQIDGALAAHVANPDPALGANQLVADLAVIALDLPALDRGVIVANPIDTAPPRAFLSAYRAALEGAAPPGTDPLLAPTSLVSMFESIPQARAAGDVATDGDVLVRTLRPAPAPTPLTKLGTDQRRTSASIVSLSGMVPGGVDESGPSIAALRRRVDTAMSAALTPAQQLARLRDVRASVQRTVESVRLPETQTITLTSKTADIPLTIHRTASGPTVVRLDFSANTNLQFLGGSSRVVHLPTTSTAFRIRVHADSPGDSIVQVRATSPNGTLLADTTKLVVRSTAVSGMGLIISFGSLAFLFLWWGRDIVRRRRRARVRPADLITIDDPIDADDP